MSPLHLFYNQRNDTTSHYFSLFSHQRAWHGSTVFNGKLHIFGGTPLNNEVWRLDTIQKIPRREPSTRSMYNTETYNMTWEFLGEAPWSTRVGMGVVSQWYFNATAGETLANSTERIVLTGGYGGWIKDQDIRYDGYHCMADSWESRDGKTWTLLNELNPFGERAWHANVVQSGLDVRIDAHSATLGQDIPPTMVVIGGGKIGFWEASTDKITSMNGWSDVFLSTDGVNWIRTTYTEGMFVVLCCV
jgi:hypothetical protein